MVSALVWGGKPYALLKAATQSPQEVWSSPELLAELRNTLAYPKLQADLQARGLDAQALFDQVALIVHVQNSPPLARRVCIDPDDDAVLACAKAARADWVVSGDKKHLLPLGRFEGIPIVTVAQALDSLEA